MYGTFLGNRQFRAALGEKVFSWLLNRPDFLEWLDQALMEGGTELFSNLDCLTSIEVSRVLLGMKRPWESTQNRTVGGAADDVETFFVKKLKKEISMDSFLHSLMGDDGLPVTTACLSCLGEAVKRTRYYGENATDLRRRIRNTKAVREVMGT